MPTREQDVEDDPKTPAVRLTRIGKHVPGGLASSLDHFGGHIIWRPNKSFKNIGRTPLLRKSKVRHLDSAGWA